MKIRYVIYTTAAALFGIMLCIPGAIGVLHGPASDNSTCKPMPRAGLAVTSPTEFTTQFESWFNGSFSLRRQLIGWNSRLRLALFGESAVPDVCAGQHGWFYYTGESTMEDYENISPYSENELVKIGKILESRRIWLDAQGIKFFVVVVPNKQTIYPEYLPPSFHPIGKLSRLDQVARYLKAYPDLEFIDLREALGAAKRQRPTFYMTDSHWNNWGAFIGCRALLQRVKKYFPAVDMPGEDNYTVTTGVCTGRDLADMLMLNNFLKDEFVEMAPHAGLQAVTGSRQYPDPATRDDRTMVVKETGNRRLPKALVFRDSFGTALIPFLAESFQSSVYVWTFNFLPELIDKEKPNVVILECVERYINALEVPNPRDVDKKLPNTP